MYKWDGRPFYPEDGCPYCRENLENTRNRCKKSSRCGDNHEANHHGCGCNYGDRCKPEKKTFTNSTSITISDPPAGQVAAASPYPSQISVSGLKGCVKHITVTIHNFTHTQPEDVHMLLVDPEGHAVYLMGNTGGGGDANNLTITFDDCATRFLPDNTQLTSGTFKPTTFTLADFPIVAAPDPNPPGPPYVNALSLFSGKDPNGNWKLYVMDNLINTSTGSIAGGWSLTICIECKCKCGCN